MFYLYDLAIRARLVGVHIAPHLSRRNFGARLVRVRTCGVPRRDHSSVVYFCATTCQKSGERITSGVASVAVRCGEDASQTRPKCEIQSLCSWEKESWDVHEFTNISAVEWPN